MMRYLLHPHCKIVILSNYLVRNSKRETFTVNDMKLCFWLQKGAIDDSCLQIVAIEIL